MRVPPSDIAERNLAEALARHWAFRVASLEYLPVGFGAHHWDARDGGGSRRFVTVDGLDHSHLGPDASAAYDALDRALRTAAALRDEHGLEFVVAPYPTINGRVTHRLDDAYAISVFPFVAGSASDHGAYTEADRRAGTVGAVLRMLGRLHSVPASDGGLAGTSRDTFEIPHRGELQDALDALGTPWQSGPFSELARRLLGERAEHVEAAMAAYDAMTVEALGGSDSWVLTHGEPHRSNVIRVSPGRLVLVDWDTVKVAPRERDLWMILGRDAVRDRAAWDDYAPTARPTIVNETTLELYRTWWRLSEIASFTGELRRPHARTPDTETAWRALRGYLIQVGVT